MRNQNDRILKQIKKEYGEEGEGGRKRGVSFAFLAILLAAVFFYSFLCVVELDFMRFSPSYVVKYITQNVRAFGLWVMGNGTTNMINLIFRQYLVITLVGMVLGGAGAMYKVIFRNILAAPTTMGVQEGGILGNMLFIGIYGTTASAGTSLYGGTLLQKVAANQFFEVYGQPLFIFFGCFFGIGLVLLIATAAGRHGLSSSALILSGTVVNGAIAGMTGAVQYYVTVYSGDEELVQILMRGTMGTFDESYRAGQLEVMAAALLPCLLLMFFLLNKMNVYAMGEEEARGMGMNVPVFRWFIIWLGAFMTAVTMVFCGHIAFVGYIVPQIAVKLVGADFRRLFPASLLLGGILMLVVYDFAKFVGLTDGLSMITTTIGGVMLLYMLLRRRGLSDGGIA